MSPKPARKRVRKEWDSKMEFTVFHHGSDIPLTFAVFCLLEASY
jgi:hypothetical protein